MQCRRDDRKRCEPRVGNEAENRIAGLKFDAGYADCNDCPVVGPALLILRPQGT